MKGFLFVGLLLIVLVMLFSGNVQEGMTSYTPQEIYDALKIRPSYKINNIISMYKSNNTSNVGKMLNLKETDPEYANKKEALNKVIINNDVEMNKLQSISKEHQKKLASAYMEELKAANPDLIV